MAPSTDDVALSDVVNGIPSFRRAWSSAIAIASPNDESSPSYLLPLATRQVPVPLTYYVRVRRQNAATHRLLVRVNSLFVRLKLRIFSDSLHGASYGRVWQSVKKLVWRFHFFFLFLSFHRCSVAASLRSEWEAKNRVLWVWGQGKRIWYRLSCGWRRSCTSKLGFAIFKSLIWA